MNARRDAAPWMRGGFGLGQPAPDPHGFLGGANAARCSPTSDNRIPRLFNAEARADR
jgi:hypothetical protein